MTTIQPIPQQLRPYFKSKFDKINWSDMSRNPSPGAIKLLEQNVDKICWYALSSNPSPGAIKLLEANPDKIRWDALSYNSNPDAIKLIETNPSHEEIDWGKLSSNPHAIKLLEANQDKIDWDELSLNPKAWKLLDANPTKINWDNYDEGGPGSTTTITLTLTWDKVTDDDLEIVNINWRALSALKSRPSPAWLAKLEQNINKLDWGVLSANDNSHMMHILEQNVDKIIWRQISTNTNPRAIRILEQNPDKINWFYLACNPAACDLISKNLDKIAWYRLSSNPSPAAIPLIEHASKVLDCSNLYWPQLTKNQLAVNILKRNPTKICWRTAPAELFDVIPCPKIQWDYSNVANIKRRRRVIRRSFHNWSVYKINKYEEDEREILSYKNDVWENPNIFVDADSQICIVCYDSTTTQTQCCLQPLCKGCNKSCKNSCKS